MNGAVITGLPLMTVNDGAPLAATGVLEVIELNVRLGAAHPTQPVPGIYFMHLPMDLSWLKWAQNFAGISVRAKTSCQCVVMPRSVLV